MKPPVYAKKRKKKRNTGPRGRGSTSVVAIERRKGLVMEFLGRVVHLPTRSNELPNLPREKLLNGAPDESLGALIVLKRSEL